MFFDAASFIVQTLGHLFAMAVLLRFALQALRVAFANPFAQFIVAVTDFAVKPLRRLVPGWGGYDWASLLLAWLVSTLTVFLLQWLRGFPFSLVGGEIWLALLGLGLVALVKLAVYLLMGLVLMRAVLSWLNPYSSLSPVIYPLTEPFLRPLRNLIPMIAQVDLSPLVLILLCQFLLSVFITAMERSLWALF
jgi:YggT family protein